MKEMVYRNPERKRFNFLLCIIHGGILIATAIILTLLVLACRDMFLAGRDQEEKFNAHIEKLDSISRAALLPIKVKNDSIIISQADTQLLLNRIQEVEKNQSEYFSNLRQESNNLINKYNGWLGFWIAILAIFGGVAPIVIQYILHQKSKWEMEKMYEELRKKAINHHLLLTVSSIYVDRECGAINDSSIRPALMNFLINESYKSFESLIEIIDNSQGYLDLDSETYIIHALVQYSRLIYILMDNASGRETRRLNELWDKIKTLIEDLMKHEDTSRDEIWRRVIDLRPQLYGLKWNN